MRPDLSQNIEGKFESNFIEKSNNNSFIVRLNYRITNGEFENYVTQSIPKTERNIFNLSICLSIYLCCLLIFHHQTLALIEDYLSYYIVTL